MSNNTKINNNNDEFFTLMPEIEKEVQHYIQHFEGKTVYCNCDNYVFSNFWHYFVQNFDNLKLKEVISTYWINGGRSFVRRYAGTGEGTLNQLEGDGDFRSKECVELLKEADIIVTNPPFSLFLEYVKLMMDNNKKFLIIGNLTSNPNDNMNICWFTNLDSKINQYTIDINKTE